jgi:hypothetical protein
MGGRVEAAGGDRGQTARLAVPARQSGPSPFGPPPWADFRPAGLGEGRPLEGATRSRMERGFGASFSDVRIHDDTRGAAAAARSSARAFAVGQDIAFGHGEYRPGTLVGDAIIAHELAHTLQQKQARGGELLTSARESALDATADRAALSVLTGKRASGLLGRSGLALQRCDGGKKTGTQPAAAAGALDPAALPPELVRGLGDAWAASFPRGTSKEQGGILVRKADGTTEWRAGTNSTSGSFNINYGDLKSGETLEATGHTHPYDPTEGNYTDVAFSDADLANLVTGAERMKFVRSGDMIFMAKKTATFDALVAGKDAAALATLRANMKTTWKDARTAATGTMQEKVIAAVKAVCNAYGLELYAGKGSSLAKVDVTK